MIALLTDKNYSFFPSYHRKGGIAMTNKKDFTFLSTDGATQLHGIVWEPTEAQAVAVLQIAHGVAEYIDRYDDFARFLNSHGVVVAGHDHLGHGQSVTANGTPVYFGDGATWETVTDDIYALHGILKEQYPTLPQVLMGHSMGSFLARSYLIRYPSTVEAAILMGTGWQGSLTLAGGLLLCNLLISKGADKTSPLITNLAFGGYNKKFKNPRTPSDWLSVDEENVDAYITDPLCGGDTTVGLFREMLRGIRFNQRFHSLDKMDGTTPVLLISGNSDPVGGMGAGVHQTYLEFKRSGVADCTTKLYSGLRHEILNEKAHRDEVYNDIWNWMEERL